MALTATMTQKRAALASEVQDVLDAHEKGWTVSTRFHRSAERPGASKAERNRIMGSPVRYVRIAHIGGEEAGAGARAASGAVLQTSHVFAVFLWRQYEDTTANQGLWDAITEGDAPLGILPHLRRAQGLLVGTSPNEVVFFVEPPGDVIIPDEPLNLGDEDFCWYLQFFITLT